ncbi:hypothetical protein PPRY_b0578 [Pseudoalteromonas prydzensis ACAM 620]|nr:hypothetical protein [Pseudoalteromonas prydzensis ACAM 620]
MVTIANNTQTTAMKKGGITRDIAYKNEKRNYLQSVQINVTI